jgi:hypothetical protein
VLARCAILFILGVCSPVSAQFAPALLQNASYWGDGKAEFDLYDAQLVRAGQPRRCEMIMTLQRDTFSPELFASDTRASTAGPVTGIRMSQMFTVPLGLSVEQHSLSVFWSLNGDFYQALLVTASGRGNRVIKAETIAEIKDFCFESQDEHGQTGGADHLFRSDNKTYVLYDELPLRVRAIEFVKTAGEFDIQLATPLANPPAFNPAKVSYKVNERSIEIEVRQGDARDHFTLDRDFPFLLREWKTRDGSQFKLMSSLKVDPANYTKNGDRERALKDPMLRHPD